MLGTCGSNVDWQWINYRLYTDYKKYFGWVFLHGIENGFCFMFYDTSPYPSNHPAFVGHHVCLTLCPSLLHQLNPLLPFSVATKTSLSLHQLNSCKGAWYCFQQTTTILVQNLPNDPTKVLGAWGTQKKVIWIETPQKSPNKKVFESKTRTKIPSSKKNIYALAILPPPPPPFVQNNASNSKLRNTFRDTPRFEFKNFPGHETPTTKSPDRCYLVF